MVQIACRDGEEASCTIAGLLAELDFPCKMCRSDGTVVLTGRSPTGEAVTVRLMPGGVLEVEGCEELAHTIRKRRCPYGR